MTTSDIIASVALVVSVASVALAYREAGRRDEEIKHLRQEGERRDEEIKLQREQVAATRAERQRQERARITVGERIRAEGSSRDIAYTVPVQNTGAFMATEIGVELVGQDKQIAGTGRLDRALVPGESDVVYVVTPPIDRFSGPYQIYVLWTDGRGANRESSGVEVGRP